MSPPAGATPVVTVEVLPCTALLTSPHRFSHYRAIQHVPAYLAHWAVVLSVSCGWVAAMWLRVGPGWEVMTVVVLEHL